MLIFLGGVCVTSSRFPASPAPLKIAVWGQLVCSVRGEGCRLAELGAEDTGQVGWAMASSFTASPGLPPESWVTAQLWR